MLAAMKDVTVPEITKGRSPFHPGQPVPVELFVGRADQIERLVERGIKQVEAGKPVAVFVQGEYGIGKSSIAAFLQELAEREHLLHTMYAPLAGCRTLPDVASAVLQAAVHSGTFEPDRSEKLRNWLAKYIGKQTLFGVTVNLETLRADAPAFATPFALLDFLKDALDRLAGSGVKGLFLVLDELNGIAGDPAFPQFLKGLVDTNAVSRPPLPLLLMLCGTDERRGQLIQGYEPIGRVFDVVDIPTMSGAEMREFYERAFQAAQMIVDEDAMAMLGESAAGFPKIMHEIGEAAYWADRDGRIDLADAVAATLAAAEEVGRKYVDHQVYDAVRSPDYRSILDKIATQLGPLRMSFTTAEVTGLLTASERPKFNNFLQKMKRLNVLRSGESRGEYVFNVSMVKLYIWLRARPRAAGAGA
jgi:hypothetical protein